MDMMLKNWRIRVQHAAPLHLILVCVILPAALTVQAQTVFSCPDGRQYDGVIHITLPVNANHPALEDNLPNPYTVTVLGLNEAVPVLSIEGDTEQQICGTADVMSERYSALLPSTGQVQPSPAATTVSTSTTGVFQIDTAEVTGGAGEFLLFIDGGSSVRQDRDGDVYEMAITPEMVASGIPLTVYVFSPDSQYDPSLALVDDRGRVVTDENNQPITCDNAGDVDECYGESVSLAGALLSGYRGQEFAGTAQAAMLALPLTDALAGTTLRLRVDTGRTPGEYALVLHTGSGVKPSTDIAAALTENPDGTLALTCNGETVFENGVKIALPPQTAASRDMPYRVTLVGNDMAVPVLAVFNAAGTGSCFQQTPAAVSYSLQLPRLALAPSANSAQGELPPDASLLVIGNRDSLPENLTVVIEGYAVASSGTGAPAETEAKSSLPETISGAAFSLTVSPGMAAAADFLTVFLISAVDNLDVVMAQVDDSGAIMTGLDGQPLGCDNSGVVLLCQDGTEVLNGYQITLADGRILPTFGLDAMLVIPVLPENAGSTIHLVTSSVQQTGGAYVLLLNFKPN